MQFNDATPLDISYYTDDKYNAIRRCKLLLFSHCIGNNEKFLQIHLLNKIVRKKQQKNTELLNKLFTNNVVDIINSFLFKIYITKNDIVKQLEKSCLSKTLKKAKQQKIRCLWSDENFVNIYHSICYKISSNLDPESCINSKYLLRQVINNNIDLCNIAEMTSSVLCPEKYELLNKKINERTNFERNNKFSKLYKCCKCKRNQTTTERRYNRSWDEGINLTVHCLFCGNSWGA